MEDKHGGKEIFSQENVIVYTTGPLKEDVAFIGRLLIVEQEHDLVIEWHPKEQAELSPKFSPDCESFDWENISGVGFKAKTKDSDSSSVEFRKVPRMPNIISFDLSDLASYKRSEETTASDNSKAVISFFLKDGSNIAPFHFETNKATSFLDVLKLHRSFKRSHKDSLLYLVEGNAKTTTDTKSFADIELYDAHKSPTISKVFRDPSVLMGSFSRVTNYFIDNFIFSNEVDSSSEDYQNDRIAELLQESLPAIHIDHHEESGYELITCFKIPPRGNVKREDPVTLDDWYLHVDCEGRIRNPDHLKQRIFKGGLDHDLRSMAWKYLVGFYDFNLSAKDNAADWNLKKDYYYRMKLQWKSMSLEQESRFAALRERKNLIEKDVNRTDRTHAFFEGEGNVNIQTLYDILMTYCMYNFDLGYVQGMSDLLSPILVVMNNEAEAFWCFACWMKKIGLNFEMDQLGIKTQLLNLHRLLHFIDTNLCSYLENHDSGNLYFAFRWILILFKRDFKFEEVMRIWEVLWTGLPCENFHLLICIAILDSEKATIMENNFGLSEILKHLNDMAYKLNLEEILCKAEAIYYQITSCEQVPDIIRGILGLQLNSTPGTPPPAENNFDRLKEDQQQQLRTSTPKPPPRKEAVVDSSLNSINSDEYEDISEQIENVIGLFD